MIAIDAGCTRKLKWKCSCLLEVALWVQNILLINVLILHRLVLNLLTSRELEISFYSISLDSLIHHLCFLLTYYTKKNSIVTNLIWKLYLQHPCGIEVKNIILKCPRDSIVWWFFSVSVPTSIWPHKVMLIYTEAWVILLLPSFPIPSLEGLLMLPLSLLSLELLLLLSLSLPSLEPLHYSLIKIPVWKSSNDLGSNCFHCDTW